MKKHSDGTIELSLTLTKEDIETARQKIVSQAASTLEIKGFRKGKAPLSVAQKHLDPSKINDQVISQLLPPNLSQKLRQLKLNPISHPHLQVVSLKPEEDWQFTIELAQFPEFKLGDYKSTVKSALASTEIVTSKDAPKQSADQKLTKLFDALLETEVPIPSILISDEVNQALSKLVNQIQKLGLTLDQYLASLKKNPESLRQEYETTARNNLKLEFIIQKISEDLNIAVDSQEVDAMIATIPDEATRKAMDTPHERTHISSILRKRKTIDFLLKP